MVSHFAVLSDNGKAEVFHTKVLKTSGSVNHKTVIFLRPQAPYNQRILA